MSFLSQKCLNVYIFQVPHLFGIYVTLYIVNFMSFML